MIDDLYSVRRKTNTPSTSNVSLAITVFESPDNVISASPDDLIRQGCTLRPA